MLKEGRVNTNNVMSAKAGIHVHESRLGFPLSRE